MLKNSGIYGNSVLSSQLLNSKWFLNKKLIETNEADKKKKRKPDQTSTLLVLKWKFCELLDTTHGASDLVGLTCWEPRISICNRFQNADTAVLEVVF